MPTGLAILVNAGGSLTVTRPSEIKLYFEQYGHTDEPESLYEIITAGDIEPNGESV